MQFYERELIARNICVIKYFLRIGRRLNEQKKKKISRKSEDLKMKNVLRKENLPKAYFLSPFMKKNFVWAFGVTSFIIAL